MTNVQVATNLYTIDETLITASFIYLISPFLGFFNAPCLMSGLALSMV
jgi:hypothetical protein